MIKYSMNKLERYIPNNMPEKLAILYDRFIDKNFIIQAIKLMILDEGKDEKKFDKIQFTMFKVDRRRKISKRLKSNTQKIVSFRASFVILVSHLLITSWNNYTCLFVNKQKKNKKVVIE